MLFGIFLLWISSLVIKRGDFQKFFCHSLSYFHTLHSDNTEIFYITYCCELQYLDMYPIDVFLKAVFIIL